MVFFKFYVLFSLTVVVDLNMSCRRISLKKFLLFNAFKNLDIWLLKKRYIKFKIDKCKSILLRSKAAEKSQFLINLFIVKKTAGFEDKQFYTSFSILQLCKIWRCLTSKPVVFFTIKRVVSNCDFSSPFKLRNIVFKALHIFTLNIMIQLNLL